MVAIIPYFCNMFRLREFTKSDMNIMAGLMTFISGYARFMAFYLDPEHPKNWEKELRRILGIEPGTQRFDNWNKKLDEWKDPEEKVNIIDIGIVPTLAKVKKNELRDTFGNDVNGLPTLLFKLKDIRNHLAHNNSKPLSDDDSALAWIYMLNIAKIISKDQNIPQPELVKKLRDIKAGKIPDKLREEIMKMDYLEDETSLEEKIKNLDEEINEMWENILPDKEIEELAYWEEVYTSMSKSYEYPETAAHFSKLLEKVKYIKELQKERQKLTEESPEILGQKPQNIVEPNIVEKKEFVIKTTLAFKPDSIEHQIFAKKMQKIRKQLEAFPIEERGEKFKELTKKEFANWGKTSFWKKLRLGKHH
jgi:hypothetical protein